MTLRYGPRGEPLYFDGRPIWIGPNGEALTDHEANEIMRTGKNRVAQTVITQGRRRTLVSTIHLLTDQSFMDEKPVLWETMAFGGRYDGFCLRYTSLQEARRGHRLTVAMMRAHEAAVRDKRRRMHAAYRARNRKAFA